MGSALKVLMVGNSFSLSCRSYLPDIVKSLPDCELKLEIAYIGGCSLQRHIREYETSRQDPEHRPYTDIADRPASLQEFLKRDRWDIISIQQASHCSWQPATYEPWAEKLITIIRETNPQAEIIIQQTWSYNAGDIRINTAQDEWGLDQAGMFSCLNAAYRSLARKYAFRVVPAGLAVQLTRKDSPRQLPRMDEKLKTSLVYPAPLPETDDAAGRCWYKDSDSGKILCADTIHLNRYGEYLQGCVWEGFLFKVSPESITFEPADLPDKARLAKYRSAAEQALQEYSV